VANGGTGILTAGTQAITSPEVARRAWPQWLALGVAMIAVGVTAVLRDDVGARLLLGALGVFLAARGALLLRGAGAGVMDATMAGRARGLGGVALVVGAAALVVAVVSGTLAARVLLVAVPVALLVSAGALFGRGTRRGGQALLLWSVLVTGLLVVTGVAQDWSRASDVATVVAALAVAALGVPLIVAAANLRTVAATPVPAPARPAACAGCACGAGGCGA
jgi:hypothetical protein